MSEFNMSDLIFTLIIHNELIEVLKFRSFVVFCVNVSYSER